MIDWLIDDWLMIDWLIEWLLDWLIDLLIDWLAQNWWTTCENMWLNHWSPFETIADGRVIHKG